MGLRYMHDCDSQFKKYLKVGDKCYISIGSGRIRLITIDEIKPASVKVSGGWSGLLMTASNDFLKVE